MTTHRSMTSRRAEFKTTGKWPYWNEKGQVYYSDTEEEYSYLQLQERLEEHDQLRTKLAEESFQDFQSFVTPFLPLLKKLKTLEYTDDDDEKGAEGVEGNRTSEKKKKMTIRKLRGKTDNDGVNLKSYDFFGRMMRHDLESTNDPYPFHKLHINNGNFTKVEYFPKSDGELGELITRWYGEDKVMLRKLGPMEGYIQSMDLLSTFLQVSILTARTEDLRDATVKCLEDLNTYHHYTDILMCGGKERGAKRREKSEYFTDPELQGNSHGYDDFYIDDQVDKTTEIKQAFPETSVYQFEMSALNDGKELYPGVVLVNNWGELDYALLGDDERINGPLIEKTLKRNINEAGDSSDREEWETFLKEYSDYRTKLADKVADRGWIVDERTRTWLESFVSRTRSD